VVVPAFNVENQIQRVLETMPDFVDRIVVVDDCCTDRTADVVLEAALEKVTIIRHARNGGVGAAMKTGFAECLEKGYDIVVKMDGDDQMDPRYLPALLYPLCKDECDYVKGNRFDLNAENYSMPLIRRFGNLALSFVNKAASGYWHIFDPQNGFIAIKSKTLKKLRLDWIDDSYYFENSMLVALNIVEARVADVFIPSRYADEKSHLRISWVLRSFPYRLIKSFFRRSFYRYFFKDFSPVAVLLISGMTSFLFGIVWSGMSWYESALAGHQTPLGTVAIGLVTIILGFQLLLTAMLLDIQETPMGLHKSFDYPLKECEKLLWEDKQRQEESYSSKTNHKSFSSS
jgi:glycosyltransferase involved in cell wall biosynthesis